VKHSLTEKQSQQHQTYDLASARFVGALIFLLFESFKRLSATVVVVIVEEAFSRDRNCGWRFKSVFWDRDYCCVCGDVATQLVAHGHLWGWTGRIALLFLAAARLYPAALKPLNRLWLKLGLLLHKVMNPMLGITENLTIRAGPVRKPSPAADRDSERAP
jgi:hypothetical protein